MSVPERKEQLRARFRAYRQNLDEASYRQKSTAICERVEHLPEIQRADTIHVYWPLVERGEVDTRPLIRRLQEAGKRLVLPRVAELAPQAAPRMEHLLFTGEANLVSNRWGLLEPDDTEEVPPDALDAVFVPALGAGRNGHRIGQGAGYYDAFLRDVSCPTVGLIYADCLVDAVPVAAHDVPLSVLVTEHEVVRTGH